MGVTDYKLQKKKTSKLKDIVTETILNETQKEKRPKNNEQSISESWDNFKQFNVHIVGLLEGKDKKIFEETIADYFHNLIKIYKLTLQQTES